MWDIERRHQGYRKKALDVGYRKKASGVGGAQLS